MMFLAKLMIIQKIHTHEDAVSQNYSLKKLLMLHWSQTHLCIYRSRSPEEFKMFCIYASNFQESIYTGM